MAPSSVGLPYGMVPRLLIAWVTTEAVRIRERELVLGESLSGFMSELDGLLPKSSTVTSKDGKIAKHE